MSFVGFEQSGVLKLNRKVPHLATPENQADSVDSDRGNRDHRYTRLVRRRIHFI
jgi:hypothetical protein